MLHRRLTSNEWNSLLGTSNGTVIVNLLRPFHEHALELAPPVDGLEQKLLYCLRSFDLEVAADEEQTTELPYTLYHQSIRERRQTFQASTRFGEVPIWVVSVSSRRKEVKQYLKERSRFLRSGERLSKWNPSIPVEWISSYSGIRYYSLFHANWNTYYSALRAVEAELGYRLYIAFSELHGGGTGLRFQVKTLRNVVRDTLCYTIALIAKGLFRVAGRLAQLLYFIRAGNVPFGIVGRSTSDFDRFYTIYGAAGGAKDCFLVLVK